MPPAREGFPSFCDGCVQRLDSSAKRSFAPELTDGLKTVSRPSLPPCFVAAIATLRPPLGDALLEA
eukprot:NODE_17983_length_916_cov_10.670469.p4 GENE.NODE_17983_length_916_cov_10.670469~~NODE_17983_length_916_cov_10.670469.p4  ORF type:complete len:66 (-),score=2.79 NODE_17983_length_916_cov_10.670469:82-279(-)